MNIKKLTVFVVILIAAYVFNNYFLKIPLLPFTGIVLLLWIFVGFLAVLIMKFYKKKRGIKQDKESYVFPDLMAKMMKNVDIRTQYEASLLSICFILIGLIAMAIYTVTFLEMGWWPKSMIIFNTFWGFVFLSSFLVTNYQQYVSYLQTEKIMDELKGSTKDLIPTTADFSLPALPDFDKLDEEIKDKLESPIKNKNLKKMKGGQNKHG